MDLSQVLPNLPLAVQAADVGEAFLELAPDGWRERGASARRFVDGQERLGASFLIALNTESFQIVAISNPATSDSK